MLLCGQGEQDLASIVIGTGPDVVVVIDEVDVEDIAIDSFVYLFLAVFAGSSIFLRYLFLAVGTTEVNIPPTPS